MSHELRDATIIKGAQVVSVGAIGNLESAVSDMSGEDVPHFHVA